MSRILGKLIKPRPAERILSDDEGIAAIEFALIAPLIIGVYLGLAELSLALTVDRKLSHSASVAGDLATQIIEVDQTSAEDIVSATLRIADVKSIPSYIVHLESFERDSDGNVTSLGEIVYGESNRDALPTIDPATLDPQILSEDSGVVIARVAYQYSPMGLKRVKNDGSAGNSYLPTAVNMNETFMLKPRRSQTVPFGPSDKDGFSCTGTIDNITCTAIEKSGGSDDDDDD